MLILDFSVVGNKLYSFRKKTGLTQFEVAEKAGISSRTYADIERGCVNMRVETLLKICQVLHITPDEVLTADDDTSAVKQIEILNRLENCSAKDKQTALSLLSTYLKSLNN